MRHAFRLAVEVGRLRRQVRLLRGDLLLSRAETARAQEALRLRTRDVQFLTSFLHSREAVEVLSDLRRLDKAIDIDDLLGEAS